MTVDDMRKLIEGQPGELEIVIQDGESEAVLPTGTGQVGHYEAYNFTVGGRKKPNAIAIWSA